MDRVLQLVSRVSFGAAILGTVGYTCLYTVDGGERAVIWDMKNGVREKTSNEGTHIRIPVYERVNIVDIRTRPKPINTTTGTKDLQTVKITLRVLYKPDENKLANIVKNYGYDYDDRILPSIGNEVMKAVVAKYDAEELITRREAVSKEISKILMIEGEKYGIQFVDISITDLTFGKEFTQAVERKKVAEQDAEKQKFVVLKAEQEKLANIIRAEGESESARMISESLKKSGEGLVELRRIEAAKEIAEVLANSKNVTYLPSGASADGGNGVSFLFAPPK